MKIMKVKSYKKWTLKCPLYNEPTKLDVSMLVETDSKIFD